MEYKRERMLIAVGLDHEVHVLIAKGTAIENDIRSAIASDLGLDALTDEPGLWVVTVTPKWVDDEGGDDGAGYTEYCDGAELRELTFIEGSHVFNRQFGAVKAGWEDIEVGVLEDHTIDPEETEEGT